MNWNFFQNGKFIQWYRYRSWNQQKGLIFSDFYNKTRPHYLGSIEMKKDTNFEKVYEMKKIVNKRLKKYEKITITQYLIRWLGYDSEYDEWKSLAVFADCMNLIKKYEKKWDSKNPLKNLKRIQTKSKNFSKKKSQKNYRKTTREKLKMNRKS